MADVRENQMAKTQTADFIRCLLGANSLLISPADLLSFLFSNRVGTSYSGDFDWNEIPFGKHLVREFTGNNKPNSNYSYGIIIHIGVSNRAFQLFIPENLSALFIRYCYNEAWTGWKSITLT